jgi:hypothetical protein
MPGILPVDSMDMLSGSENIMLAAWARDDGEGYFIGVRPWQDGNPTEHTDIRDFKAWRLPAIVSNMVTSFRYAHFGMPLMVSPIFFLH